MPSHRSSLLTAVGIALLVTSVSHAVDNQAQDQQNPAKVIVQSGTSSGVPVKGAAPQLHLSDAQRTRIREVLNTTHSDVSLQVKENQGALLADLEKAPRNRPWGFFLPGRHGQSPWSPHCGSPCRMIALFRARRRLPPTFPLRNLRRSKRWLFTLFQAPPVLPRTRGAKPTTRLSYSGA